MFSFGYLEILVVLVVVVLLFPPAELPKLARSVARAYGTVRRTADDFRRSLLMDDELRKPIDEIRGAYRDARWDLEQAGRNMMSELKQVSEDTRQAIDVNQSIVGDGSASDPADDTVNSLSGRVPASVDTPLKYSDENASESGDPLEDRQVKPSSPAVVASKSVSEPATDSATAPIKDIAKGLASERTVLNSESRSPQISTTERNVAKFQDGHAEDTDVVRVNSTGQPS